MFVKLLLISILLLAVSGIFFGIRILVKKNGKFPETHVGRNREMRKRGISCAQDTNIGCIPADDSGSCSTCGRELRAGSREQGDRGQEQRAESQGQ